MRVLLDTTFARRAPRSGTAVYVEQLAVAMAEAGGVELVEVYNPRRASPSRGRGRRRLGSAGNALADQWWTELELPRLAASAGAQVIHHPLPARSHARPTAQVVTVHDLAFERLPECFAPGFRRYAHFAHRDAARAAGAVVCVSQSTAEEVQRLWGVPATRIVVALHGPGQRLTAADSGRRRLHFLYVGDDEPRKNLATLRLAYGRYRQREAQPLELVLAGSARGGGAGVRCEGNPTRERLAELYAGAVALVHPALYEGFGLTPLEAMALGTPVIAARAPGVTEVCGDAARYVNPLDPDSLAAAMTALAHEPGLQAELGDRGRSRAARFSWSASARKHRDAYSLASCK